MRSTVRSGFEDPGLRAVEVHKARLELVKKYPQLSGRTSQKDLEAQIERNLNDQQRKSLQVLKQRLQALQPATRAGGGQG